MAFFTIVLALILEANRTGHIQPLYWLPPLFCLWANLHIQFIYGLFLVGLFVGVNIAQRTRRTLANHPGIRSSPNLACRAAVAVLFAACVLASCIGPYTYHLFPVVYEYSKAKVPYPIIRELQPINFRGVSHYVQLLLTGAGFFALGWRKRIDLFKFALLTIATVVAYRTMRDSWFICIPAAAAMADFPPQVHPTTVCADDARGPLLSWPERAGVSRFRRLRARTICA